MEDRDKLDALKHFSQIQRTQFDNRQKIEWRVIFTTLTFYILIAAGKLRYNIDPGINSYWIIPLYVVITLAMIVYLSLVHSRHEMNKRAAHFAEDEILSLAGKHYSFQTPCLPTWWHPICQMTIVVVFAVASCSMVYQQPPISQERMDKSTKDSGQSGPKVITSEPPVGKRER